MRPPFPVSLQQLLVAAVEDCKLLQSSATLPAFDMWTPIYPWSIQILPELCLIATKADLNIVLFYMGTSHFVCMIDCFNENVP